MMNSFASENKELIKEISSDIVSDIAPDEFEMFNEIFEAQFSHTSGKKKKSDDMLGFGIDGILLLSSPVVIGMVSSVAGFLFQEVVKSVREQSTEVIKNKIKTIFKKNFKKGDLPVLTIEQFATVKKFAKAEAIKFGVSEDVAEKMASSLIGTMNLPQS